MTAISQIPPQSPDPLVQRRIELLEILSQTHPELISDNQLDLQKLQELLTSEQMADNNEHYELTWAGKSAARREVQKTTSHTLRPSPSNPKQAPHMLIEGENLEVLHVLQRSYYGKVKMIYIDPPYNTGNDSFVYPDDYSETLDEYLKRTGEKSEEGYLNKQSLWRKNSKESGRYHSAWLSMMYPRLFLARNLLRDDGVIFISIDDNEAANLKLLCDEAFGVENFMANVVWQKKYAATNDAKGFSNLHDHVLVYRKTAQFIRNLLPRTDEMNKPYKFDEGDGKGPWRPDNLLVKSFSASAVYPIQNPNTLEQFTPPEGSSWRASKETMNRWLEEKRIYFGKDGKGAPQLKRYLNEVQDGQVPTTWWKYDEVGHNDAANKELAAIFNSKPPFDTPKPSSLIKQMILIACNENSIVLDFFAGSGTTAHAVMALNAEDGGNRRCISVQLPEVLDESSEAYKAGYRTIADITRARIDKVITKLKTEHPEKTQGLGCAHFTLAPSNFKVWRSNVNDAFALREQLTLFKQAEKTSVLRATEAQHAMLTELLLKHGLGALGVDAVSQLLPIGEATVHCVTLPDSRAMWFCFDTYTLALKASVVAAKPAQVVLLNSCFVGQKADELLANLKLELAALEIGLTVI